MGKIQVLDKHIAELIAAGEVIDRPASVIKELVENAIDAGATAITVDIKNGGVTFMRVSDNGCGMLREDVPTAFLRHATSKICKQDDLNAIGTLGFRGEAMASIAAVAAVEVTTRTADELAGTYYAIRGGEQIEYKDCGCPQGTTVIVKDIFYNVPARMKFLKKDTVEANAVAGIVDKIALSHPEIALRFIRDGKETLHTPGDGQLKSAVYAVFGKVFTDGLLPVEYEYEHIKVWGFISKPSAARPNRSMQQFFINGRYVKSRTAAAALEQAFKGSLMVGKFPGCVLHMQLAYGAVDVNVHPNKLEVRFINEKPIFNAVYYGVQTALNQGDRPMVMNIAQVTQPQPLNVPPEKPIQMKIQTSFQKPVEKQANTAFVKLAPTIEQNQTVNKSVSNFVNRIVNRRGINRIILEDSGDVHLPPPPPPKGPAANSWTENSRIGNSDINIMVDDGENLTHRSSSVLSEKESVIPKESLGSSVQLESNTVTPKKYTAEEISEKPFIEPLRLIGEAFGTYIIAERNCQELILIDKHAAHERMLYEKLKKQAPGSESQMLLQPIPVTLEKDEYAMALQSLELFQQAGFELDDFGGGTILVRSAPISMEREDISYAVMEMAGYLNQHKSDLTTERLDWLYHNVACRAAIKAGDKSSPEELIALVEQLEADNSIRYCPHGRPVTIILKKKDLEKQFGRIQ